MRYKLKRLEPKSIFRMGFLLGWIVLGIIGLGLFIAYLIVSGELGFTEDEFLSALMGGFLAPPLFALIFAGLETLVVVVYNRLAKRLPAIEIELEPLDEQRSALHHETGLRPEDL